MIIEILIEQVNVSDDQYKLIELCKDSGKKINKGEHLLSYESSKTVFEYEAHDSGYIYFNPELVIDEFYDIGYKIGIISKESLTSIQLEEEFGISNKDSKNNINDKNATKKALKLIAENNIDINLFEGMTFITEQNVQDYLRKSYPEKDGFEENKKFENDLKEFKELLNYGRQKLRSQYNRHLPTGNILNDRWELAESFQWGVNSSVYDDCLIFGNVKLGENCWVGPFSILDGNAHPVVVGDWTSIGTGTHIYTHHTIDRALSGGKIEPATAPVSIGEKCFISPQVMIAPGTKIGNSCFVTAQSYVEGSFSDFSIISGNPAKIVGKIEISGNKIKKIFFDTD